VTVAVIVKCEGRKSSMCTYNKIRTKGRHKCNYLVVCIVKNHKNNNDVLSLSLT